MGCCDLQDQALGSILATLAYHRQTRTRVIGMLCKLVSSQREETLNQCLLSLASQGCDS